MSDITIHTSLFWVRTEPKALPKKSLQYGYSQSRSVFPSLRESLYRRDSVQRQSIGHPIALTNIRSSTPVINAIHHVVSLFGMGYMTQSPLLAKPNSEHSI